MKISARTNEFCCVWGLSVDYQSWCSMLRSCILSSAALMSIFAGKDSAECSPRSWLANDF